MTTKERQCSLYQAGDAVLTSYGAGVIVEVCSVHLSKSIVAQEQHQLMLVTEYRYSVRLWRVPNRSVGSSSLAQLRSSAVRFVCCNVIVKLCIEILRSIS
jgi:hypothetical protein